MLKTLTELAGKPKIYLFEDISESLAKKVTKKIDKIIQAGEPHVFLLINSDGGCYLSSMYLYDKLVGLEGTIRVYTIVCGKALSAAASIFCAGHYRMMTRNSVLMMHPVSYDLSGPHNRNKSYVMHIEQHENRSTAQILDRVCSNGKREEIIRRMNDELWLSSEECVKFELSHRIIG